MSASFALPSVTMRPGTGKERLAGHVVNLTIGAAHRPVYLLGADMAEARRFAEEEGGAEWIRGFVEEDDGCFVVLA